MQTKIQFFVDNAEHELIEKVVKEHEGRVKKTHVLTKLLKLGIQAMYDLDLDLASDGELKMVAWHRLILDSDDHSKQDAANDRIVLTPSGPNDLPW